jgi:hypothetical protein
VSCCSPAAFHIWPDVRIIAGIEASTITSLGTWRLVMPRSESTMARAGPRRRRRRWRPRWPAAGLGGQVVEGVEQGGQTVVRVDAGLLEHRAVLGEQLGEVDLHACPKMIGSETFIMVALRCTENRTPSPWPGDLLGEERHQGLASSRGIDDLAGEHRESTP